MEQAQAVKVDESGSSITSNSDFRCAVVGTVLPGVSCIAPPSQAIGKTKTEKKERPPSRWKMEDFLKDEAWFRDVIGLPGRGVEVSKEEAVSEDMDRFYGKKITGGYPFKASKGCILTQLHKDEICHLKLFTDGDAKVPNDVLLVGFAKAYFLMRHVGKPINWARFAAAKHKGQLENQLLGRRQEPTPGTGIRDPNLRYFPFPGLPEILPPPECEPEAEERKGDQGIITDASPELRSGAIEGLVVSEITPGASTVSPIVDITSLSQEQSRTTGSTQQSGTCPVESLQQTPPGVGSIPAGSLKITGTNFKILDDYIAILQKELDVVVPLLADARRNYESGKAQWSEAKFSFDQAKARIQAARDAFESGSEGKAKCDKEIEKLRKSRSEMEEMLDRHFEKFNEAAANMEDGMDCSYVEQCQRDFEESTKQYKQVEKELDSKISESRCFANQVMEAKTCETKARSTGDLCNKEIEFFNEELDKMGDHMQKLVNRHSRLRYSMEHFQALHKTLNRLSETFLTPSMVPSPIKNCDPLFRLSNCPVCDLGFGCFNFMPASCGHSYHPACGLAYFQSQDEPRCRACDEPMHPTWLKGWGIPLGAANTEMEIHLGMDIHETQLLAMDHSLRKDQEAFDELQYWNTLQRRSINKRFTAAGNRTLISENDVDLALLKDGYQVRVPFKAEGLAGPTKLGCGVTKIADGKIEVKKERDTGVLLKPKAEVIRNSQDIDSPLGDDPTKVTVELVTPPDTIQAPVLPPVTRSQGGVACSKKRAGSDSVRPVMKKAKDTARLPRPPTSRNLSFGNRR